MSKKSIVRGMLLICLFFSMMMTGAVAYAAAEADKTTHTVSFEYAPLTDEERNACIREEMERLLGSNTGYRVFFGTEEENQIAPINDIDEYKTEYSPKKSVSVSGKPGGILEPSLSVSGPSDQTYYLGWTYTDEGGPTLTKGVSFDHPFRYLTVSLSLGMVSNSDKYGIEFGILDAKPGVKYKVSSISKTYDVQQYIIYKKVYNDAGTYTWSEWSSGALKHLTNRDFAFEEVS